MPFHRRPCPGLPAYEKNGMMIFAEFCSGRGQCPERGSTEMNNRSVSFLLAAVLLLSFFLPMCAAAASLPFEDVPPDAWYSADVERAYGSGLFNGVSDTRFDPAGPLKLSHAVTLAARDVLRVY